MPVLIYWGAKDPSAMLRNGQALFDVISAKNPNARMHWTGELAAKSAR